MIKGTRSDGTAIEVVVEYDSSIVSYETKYKENMGWIVNGRELPTGEVTYMGVLDETKWGTVRISFMSRLVRMSI